MNFKVIKPHEDTSFSEILKEILTFKDLMFILSRKDISVKYKQAVLGISWAVVQPLLTSAIFTYIFKNMRGTGGSLFDPQIYVSVLIWQFFSKSVLDGTNSLTNSIGIISKVYFARAILPIVSTLNAMVDFLIGYFFFLIFIFFLHSSEISYWGVILIPLYIFPVALLSLTISYILSPINALYRDVAIILPFVLQLLMYISPVIYPAEVLSEKILILSKYVPISHIILNARNIVLTGPKAEYSSLAIFAFSICAVLISLKFFKSKEQSIVDVI